ncbi:regulatory signaling modulator protein AmpE [Coxiella burnetii]|uniref:Beta-lactamase induction protein n=2 Tax=Coxiella burnetii TaxID=777 RepID=Q83E70_COXBU|nr:regulatory signaling modulator protein AmpE [Coxiella burnetii]NP_819496.1 beta-lactamase induction protein [Coxiella burnetii RSA 493]AAO90010.1 beta-lactamase induction protein [Coxiella burnetii RSA 493]ABX78865.1 putative membrane protein [Coxiella burnetii RSA 331]ACJ20573.1 beta-lactamase induction protein [Coxiella burnetii CbuK_Q154]AIT63639.1 Beta-lactamase induction protein [Coxiella burnetii str. Namibia]AML49608.1 hypothetical protein AUR58_10875 [Coxiella burnetii]
MALTAVLLCLVIQRWLHFDSYTRQYNWFEPYYQWLKARFGQTSHWNGLGGVAIIILPVVFIYILVALFICRTLTIVGYYFLTVAVLWYCMDVRSLAKSQSGAVAQKVLIHVYERVFALIFWLLILGSTGVVLYTLVITLRQFLEKSPAQNNEEGTGLLSAVAIVQGVLDWLPLRLIGITFALVGHFSPTFALWRLKVLTGIDKTPDLAAACGLTALDMNKETKLLSLEELKSLDGLISRALWVWLVVIALFTIGRWIG